jgi:hypothetical protein
MNQEVPGPPPNIPDIPDADTATNPDFTGDHAQNRILFINTRWFRYGTDDKIHSSAMVLSALILMAALIIAVLGTIGLFSGHEAKWVDTLITWVGNAFLFTSGIAVGRSGKDKEPPG